MTQPDTFRFSLDNSEKFNYLLVKNKNFENKVVSFDDYNQEMPYFILPVLKDSILYDSDVVFDDIDNAISYVDVKNNNIIAKLYSDAKRNINKISSKLMILLDFNLSKNHQDSLNILKNIDSILNTKDNNPDFLFFHIKNNIPLVNEVIHSDFFVYPEITETPLFLDENKDGNILIEIIETKKIGYHVDINKRNWSVSYYPKYEITIQDKKHTLIPYRKDGKVKREGVWDTYSTTRTLFVNKKYLISYLDEIEYYYSKKVFDINQLKIVMHD